MNRVSRLFIYGLLALGLFVYQFGFGQSVLSAGLTLGLLILPIVIAVLVLLDRRFLPPRAERKLALK